MRPSGTPTLVRTLLYTACLCVAAAYGLFFILPLHIQALGGNEATVGEILSMGAIGTLLTVGFTGALLSRIRPALLAAVGAGCYGAGALAFALPGTLSPLQHLASILLGAGWGLAFTFGPLLLSGMVDDARRSFFFSVLSAFNALGMGVAPVLARQLLEKGLATHRQVFELAAVLCCLGALLFLRAGRGIATADQGADSSSAGGEWTAIKEIARSEARYPLVMVFLGACVFSSMMNFQTTFAAAQGLDFSIFYLAYTSAVIASRFLVSGFVGRQNPLVAASVLLFLMCLAIALFGIVGSNPWLYAGSSILLGVSYGLVYPLIQALAVNLSAAAVRSRVMLYFCLSYFVGVYVFPYAGGQVIVRYGYQGLLAVLLPLALLEFLLAFWRLACQLPLLRQPAGWRLTNRN